MSRKTEALLTLLGGILVAAVVIIYYQGDPPSPRAMLAQLMNSQWTRNSSPWTFSVTTDKLTDKQIVTATVSASTPSLYNYSLEFKCDGEPRIEISSFDKAAKPRPMPFDQTSRVVDRAPFTGGRWIPGYGPVPNYQTLTDTSLNFRYRIDDDTPDNGSLGGGKYSNAGEMAWPYDRLEVPTTRLIIADVFPDETVEFPFTNLPLDQRNILNRKCFQKRRDQRNAALQEEKNRREREEQERLNLAAIQREKEKLREEERNEREVKLRAAKEEARQQGGELYVVTRDAAIVCPNPMIDSRCSYASKRGRTFIVIGEMGKWFIFKANSTDGKGYIAKSDAEKVQ